MVAISVSAGKLVIGHHGLGRNTDLEMSSACAWSRKFLAGRGLGARLRLIGRMGWTGPEPTSSLRLKPRGKR